MLRSAGLCALRGACVARGAGAAAYSRGAGWEWGRKGVQEADPELYALMKRESDRQYTNLELIPSENYTSRAVLDAMGSVLTNKYAEGYPGARYYGGNHVIDEVELLCQRRALAAFSLSPDEWGVNVQPLSGSPANFAVYTALLKPQEKLMGLDLSHGGHLTHGYKTAKKKISATSVFWESSSYKLNEQTGVIDYDGMRQRAEEFRPQLIIAGATCYTRDIEYAKFRAAADSVGAYLHVDMAHTAGMIAAGLLRSPFEYADVVSTTTHKTLRGPRAGLIFYRRNALRVDAASKARTGEDLKPLVDFAVFPGLQGGPHEHCIAGIAAALKDAASPEFKRYQERVLRNAKALAAALKSGGLDLVSGGTENHTVWVDLREVGVDGARTEAVLEEASVTCNKNTVPGDLKPFVPSGLRLGTPALTTRGLQEEDFATVAKFILRGVSIARELYKKELGTADGAKLKNFLSSLKTTEKDNNDIRALKRDVNEFAASFGRLPGSL